MSNDYFNHTSQVTAHTKAKASTLNTIYSAIAAGFEALPTLAMFRGGTTNYAAATGAANAYVVSRTFTAASLADGMHVRFKVGAGHTNTGACTLNVDSLGVRSIKLVNGNDPAAADLTAGDFIEVVYDLANTKWVIMSPVRSMF